MLNKLLNKILKCKHKKTTRLSTYKINKKEMCEDYIILECDDCQHIYAVVVPE